MLNHQLLATKLELFKEGVQPFYGKQHYEGYLKKGLDPSGRKVNHEKYLSIAKTGPLQSIQLS